MTLTPSTDHVARAKARLLHQFKDSTKLQALIESYVVQAQELEDAVHALNEAFKIDDAVGVQLDHVGKVVGELRKGKSDDRYRVFVRVRVLVNRSSGTLPQMVEILETMLDNQPNPANFEIIERYPACLEVRNDALTDIDPRDVTHLLHEAKSGGVCLLYSFILAPLENIFAYSPYAGAPADDPQRGFARYRYIEDDAMVQVTTGTAANFWVVRHNQLTDANAEWVALGDGIGRKSADGVTWTDDTIHISDLYRALAYDPVTARWLAFHDVAGNPIKYRTVGGSWADGSTMTGAQANGAASNGLGRVIAVGDSGKYCITDDGGASNTVGDFPAALTMKAIAYKRINGQDVWIAVGGTSVSPLYYSTDNGATWNACAPLDSGIALNTVGWVGGTQWILAGDNGRVAVTDDNGQTIRLLRTQWPGSTTADAQDLITDDSGLTTVVGGFDGGGNGIWVFGLNADEQCYTPSHSVAFSLLGIDRDPAGAIVVCGQGGEVWRQPQRTGGYLRGAYSSHGIPAASPPAAVDPDYDVEALAGASDLLLWAKAVAADLTLSGGDVTGWVNHGTEGDGSTAGNEPEWVSSSAEMGGHGVVRFVRGSSEIFNFNDVAAELVGNGVPFSVLVAARYTGSDSDSSNDHPLWGMGHLSDATPPEHYYARNGPAGQGIRAFTEDDAGLQRHHNTWKQVDNEAAVWSYVYDGTDATIFRNLLNWGHHGTVDMNIGTTTPNSFSIGGQCQGSTGGDVFGDWDVAEIVVVARALSEPERKNLVALLASDKGITLEDGTLDWDQVNCTRALSTATDGTGAYVDELVSTYNANVPRARTFPDDGKRYMLVEGQRIQLLDQTQDHGTSPWSSSGGSVTEDQAVGPDQFGVTADELRFVTNTNTPALQALTAGDVADSVALAFSGFAKPKDAAGQFRMALRGQQGAETPAEFAAPLPSGWGRYWVGQNSEADGANTRVRYRPHSSHPGVVDAENVYVWGSQLEVGSFPSSYIPSTTGPVTRSADRCVIPSAYVPDYVRNGKCRFTWRPLWDSDNPPATPAVLLGFGDSAGGDYWELQAFADQLAIRTLTGGFNVNVFLTFLAFTTIDVTYDVGAGTVEISGALTGNQVWTGTPWPGAAEGRDLSIGHRYPTLGNHAFSWFSEIEEVA